MKNLLLIAAAVAVFLPVFHAAGIKKPKQDTASVHVHKPTNGQSAAAVNNKESDSSEELVSEQLPHDKLIKLLHDNSVSLAEFYTRPLDADANPKVVKDQGGKQFGVVVTLDEGNRVILTTGDQKGKGQDVVNLAIATDDALAEGGWKKIWTKKISGATLGDFVKAGINDVDSLPGTR